MVYFLFAHTYINRAATRVAVVYAAAAVVAAAAVAGMCSRSRTI